MCVFEVCVCVRAHAYVYGGGVCSYLARLSWVSFLCSPHASPNAWTRSSCHDNTPYCPTYFGAETLSLNKHCDRTAHTTWFWQHPPFFPISLNLEHHPMPTRISASPREMLHSNFSISGTEGNSGPGVGTLLEWPWPCCVWFRWATVKVWVMNSTRLPHWLGAVLDDLGAQPRGFWFLPSRWAAGLREPVQTLCPWSEASCFACVRPPGRGRARESLNPAALLSQRSNPWFVSRRHTVVLRLAGVGTCGVRVFPGLGA